MKNVRVQRQWHPSSQHTDTKTNNNKIDERTMKEGNHAVIKLR